MTGLAGSGVVLAAFSASIWIWLAVARGGFWRGQPDDRGMHEALAAGGPRTWPAVVAVVPARNEAELIGTTVASLLAQRYDGSLSVIVVDDHSDDGTADVARRAAVTAGCPQRLTVIAAPALPADWTGKLWAVANGVAAAEARDDAARFLLLTDADIRYTHDAVAALVSSALEHRLVLSSLMVRLRCQSFAERTLIPAFVFFFQMLYPFAWVNQPARRTAAAAGGCVLVDREALQAAGGIASIHNELIDDCALARRLKTQGPIRLALGERVQSLRAYPAIDDVRRMIVRSAYAQLRFSPWRLAFVVVAMAIVFVAPVVLALAAGGWTRGLAIGAWALMSALFVPMSRRYGVPAWSAVALPAIAAVYLAWTVESAIRHALGRGGVWKGRVHHAPMVPR